MKQDRSVLDLRGLVAAVWGIGSGAVSLEEAGSLQGVTVKGILRHHLSSVTASHSS